MALGFVTDTATIGTTEYSLISDSTTLATETTDRIEQVLIDFNALAIGDVYRVRVYESAGSTPTKRVTGEWFVSGVQAVPNFVLPSLILGVGYDITVAKIAGTDRSISWTLARVT